NSYGAYITANCPNDYNPQGGKKPENAVKLLRKILAQNKGEKITLVVVGSNINIAGLLDSEGDEISPLSGVELVKEQVDEISLMGCYFPTKEVPEVWFGDYKMEAECNIVVDIKSAQTVFNKCPVPIVISHYLIGYYVYTGGILITTDEKNPVAKSYKVHSNGNRNSWDPISSYYAVFGTGNILTADKVGTVHIDDKGISTFKEEKNGKHIILECDDFKKAERELDLVMQGIIN
ncbi:MAG: nucleoside hydrolase, partial [Clostridia bacterium]|nr:nucleoside hydrolase [Clostridia bacterium]